MIHPFRDGNGRMARALQTLAASRGGLAEPTFCSMEEWLGVNTEDYYRILALTGAGSRSRLETLDCGSSSTCAHTTSKPKRSRDAYSAPNAPGFASTSASPN